MEPAFSFSQKIFQFATQLNFEAADWLSELTSIVEALPKHEIYQNHLQKIATNKNVKDSNQERADDNYKWGRITEYEKQLEVFNKFRDYTLNKIKGLSKNDIQEGQKIFKAVQTELHRLQEALPIYANKSEIIDKIKNNRVVIVQGNTGCGKSTQIIQYLLEIEEFEKKIALGQPYRHCLGIITQRIREESGMEVGLVPEHIHHLVSDAKLEIHTHKSLISALINDHNLSKYSCIIIDEAHQRFVESDLIIALLKQVLERNPDLRLILTSATADQEAFDRFFEKEIPKVRVLGISHDVEIKYIDSFSKNKNMSQIKNKIVAILEEEINQMKNPKSSNSDGNILIFLPSFSDVHSLINELPNSISEFYVILPFHGYLAEESQRNVFVTYQKPKIIVSTRVGETSITITDLKVVIDTGLDILRHYDRETHMTIETEGKITKSSANQRAGRTGRTCPGTCYRLYSEEDYHNLRQHEESIFRCFNFHHFIMTLKVLGIQDLTKFKFLEPLNEQDQINLKIDIEFLQNMEALDNNEQITKLGSIMSEGHLELNHTRILYEAVRLGCIDEVTQAIALYAKDWKLFNRKDGFSEAKKQFSTEDGDFLMMFTIYNEYLRQKDGKKWAEDNCLGIKSLELASDLIQSLQETISQLKSITSELGPEVHQIDIKQRILKCFFKGYWYNLCRVENDKTLTLCQVNKTINIERTSSVALSGISKNTKFMVCNEIRSGDKVFVARIFSKVAPEWVEELPMQCRKYLRLDANGPMNPFQRSGQNERKPLGFFNSKKQ